MASLEMAWPQVSLTGGLVSARGERNGIWSCSSQGIQKEMEPGHVLDERNQDWNI